MSHHDNLGVASLLLLLAGLSAGLVAAQTRQTGGIVPTETIAVKVAPGPEADVTLFATGDVLGKVEPCG